MRRRIRSAAFPVHRHSVPQLLVDGILVALAYYLAFRLRFENGFGGANDRYGDLLTHTIFWVVPVTLAVLAAFGQYQRLWTFVGQRDYEAVVKGVIVATLLIVGAIAFLHPVTTHRRLPDHAGQPAGKRDCALPAAGAGAADRRPVPRASGHRGPGAQLQSGQGRPRRADRRWWRRRPPGRARADPQPAAAAATGWLRGRRPAQARHEGRARPEGGRHDRFRGPGPGARRGRAGRSRDRDPLRSGHASGPRGGRLPRAWHPGADDPDGVRAAQGLNRSS